MFWLKKVISQFFMPVPLVLILLFAAIFFARNYQRTRKLLFLAVTLLIVLGSSWGSNTLIMHLENQYPVNNMAITESCLVLVLGNSHDENPNLTAVQQLSSPALARLMEGVRQMSLGKNCKLIVSGWAGGVSTRSHADVMFDAAVELGVDSNNIIKFPLAKDTIEEAQFMFWEVESARFRLVTSASHMPRAMTIFNHAGLNASAAPTDFAQGKGHWWQIETKNLLNSQRAIHEYLGMLWFKLRY
ncbi:hypothetical protein TUM4438_39000 [Shewanella sairae]|uniref:DUF218 domain-containing protein n=1 Tax=Shewanella sairae TaxID=190310 RepID=A0ABQ4PPZ3_9GAMM|nr:ElyC/SanA/YdcF family protein [Shewanella sairae]MCL1131382.1 YdcF family protein [Shewanella sairae]GIU50986.1 hypothetical protein TUM4438_39000 [Shewanella sairae]